MQRTIYIDSVFLINMLMDGLLLTLTAFTCKKTATFFRIMAGSLLGAAGYCLVLCLPMFSSPNRVMPVMLFLGLLMVKITCKTKGIRELIYGTGYLYTYSFLLGGFMLFVLKRVPLLSEHRESFLALSAVGIAGFIICLKGIMRYRRKALEHFCRVEVAGDAKILSIPTLVDTGNGLTEPVTGKPVAILEEEKWKDMQKWIKPEKYKVIPYHSIGKDNGILEGYEVEEIRVIGKGTSACYENVIIAVFKGKLSVKGNYQMILPAELSI